MMMTSNLCCAATDAVAGGYWEKVAVDWWRGVGVGGADDLMGGG